ncbi:MAG: hypothetical protein KA751_04260 [Comamonas sp.]|nr:hypothetical protein [Comamonas sp.]
MRQTLYLCAAEKAKGVEAGLVLREALNAWVWNVFVAMNQQPETAQQKVQRLSAPAQIGNAENCNDEEASREQRDGRDQRFHGLFLVLFSPVVLRFKQVPRGGICVAMSQWCAQPRMCRLDRSLYQLVSVYRGNAWMCPVIVEWVA